MENIKKFIEEGEKLIDDEIEKLDDIYFIHPNGYKDLGNYLKSKDNLLCRDEIYPETQYELDPDKVKDFISSRRISLIKMIVEMVESEKGINRKTKDEALDTISSKLSSLVNGEK